jgi:DNA-binding beta-propeller fold protein YncE
MTGVAESLFTPLEHWEQLPDGFVHRDVADVAVDSHDQVYVLTRQDPRVIVYDRSGRFLRAFGEGVLSARPHGITVGPEDAIYCVDEGDQTVRKFSPYGELLQIIGTSGVASDTGIDRTIADFYERTKSIRGGPPFNQPTGLAVAPNGDLYVSDGYGNCRIHHFSPTGELIGSFGEPGIGPGQFHIPHGLWVIAEGRVLVADRENDRIQVFSLDGEYQTSWTDVQRPTKVVTDVAGTAYVAELARPTGWRSWTNGDPPAYLPGRLTILDTRGNLVARFGASDDPCAAGHFVAPHGLAVDSRGDLYVAEVTYTFLYVGKQVPIRGDIPDECHTLQKFARTAAA